MKYQNQKPDLPDQIKTLVQSANSVKTVPHGIKTVNPGEGLQLLSGDGQEIFWDWETAAEYDTRISEGRAAIDQARLDLDQAEADLAAGAARLDENERILDALGPRVDAAESTVAQAAQDLNALETSFGDVQAKAEASEQKANDALTKAGAAQTSADGKNRITRATTPATEPGTAVGDTHFTMSTMGGGGRVIRQQRWDGSTWQDETVSHEVIASLDLGKATVGELDGIRVKARTLAADRFTVGVAGNLIVDPNFNDPTISGWRENGRWKWIELNGEKYFSVFANGSYTDFSLKGTSATGPSIPVTSGVSYGLTMEVKGDVQVFLYIRYANGAVVSPGASLQTLPGSGRRFATIVIRPDDYTHSNAQGTKPIEITLSVRCPSRAEVGSESAVYSARFAPRTSTVLIEDGAVTAEKVEAQSVAGAVGRFLTVQAMTGVFTESLTATDATLLGKTVAKSLTVEKLTGHDAILSGTVDVAQLNVTGAMSAEIVRAMDIQARRGIFTEGLTAQDATLLGTTVAETLNAGTVAARIMTSGMLQTTTAANRGVKIDNAGINAWDDAGTQTMRLNGTSNYITGTFATAEKEQRVEIKSGGSTASADFYGSGNTVDHLGVWHSADRGDATASRIISQNSLTWIRENPGVVLWPFRGDFGFAGRWSRNTDTVKMFSLVNYSGIPGGAWVDLTFTYPTPFPTQYSERIPVMSVESRSGAECTINTRTNNADSISFRVVNKSTNPTNELYVRGFTFNFNTVTYSTTY